MSIPVLTAITGAAWESSLVAALEHTPCGVSVVRRCVDLADLLATAAAGTARAVLISADLRRLDRDALTRLAVSRVAVVGLVEPGDEVSERRLRQLGLLQVLPADATPAAIAEAVTTALAHAPTGVDAATADHAYADPVTALPVLPGAPRWGPEPPGGERDPGTDARSGTVLAVWGPTGGPGRTSLAVGLAGELSRLGSLALLADADVYGGTVAPVLGLLDESPGLAAAVRQANAGTLDVRGLAQLAPVVVPGLRVLTGITRADRWPELRPAALGAVLELARSLAAWTVVDCAFCLEQDEELAFDTSAPRRNGATLEVLERADVVVAVGAADPVGVQRLVRGLSELREVLPGVEPRVVLNRVRRGPVGPDPRHHLTEALQRYAGVRPWAFVPEDSSGFDQALAAGRSLGEVALRSPARQAMVAMAQELSGHPVSSGRGRRRGLSAGA